MILSDIVTTEYLESIGACQRVIDAFEGEWPPPGEGERTEPTAAAMLTRLEEEATAETSYWAAAFVIRSGMEIDFVSRAAGSITWKATDSGGNTHLFTRSF